MAGADEGDMEEGGDWNGEDGDWDEGGDWDDEEWDDDYDDDYEDEEEEEAMVQIRPGMGGTNRMKNCGIHTIEIYYPQFYFKQIEMEEFDARPDRYGPSVIGKYTKGVGQIEARYPTDDEDPISFAMTVTHRLIDRMDREGFNETYKFSEDGKALPSWNSIGRLDVGSESLVDRSKSMKAYVMDLFERYGDGEANIEGVDMYNACYGGQAAGLCCENWVEGDRWDGRYGLAIATDISDAPYVAMFTVGAACTGAMYFPDAPLSHYAHRASCIMHRFDFFKPVGWFHMGPVVDGKYSIDAYMTCVETCYNTLRKKMNDRPLLQITDYNVFHTGGGYHIVKKAFERCIRAENPKCLAEERERYIKEKLSPSVNLLKIIGPCHTVSSFLNIASVCMQEWDRALGKILLVFTYGSGCASSMYQMGFSDIPWFSPLGVWKVNFYKEAIYCPPWLALHQEYVETWMKFDFRPEGRKKFQLGYDTLQMDAYYLMEIDPWGRRFFHRGGMRAGPLPKKDTLHYDKVENRSMRKKFGDLPDGEKHEKPIQDKDAVTKLEEEWKAIEFEMTYDADYDPEGQPQVVENKICKGNPNQSLVVLEGNKPTEYHLSVNSDGNAHAYQIIGTWTGMRELQDMQASYDGSWTFEVTLGANQWEQFFLIQDWDMNKRIYPAFERSWKDMPCIGPHKGPAKPQNWLINGAPQDDLPGDDAGECGDRYLVTFKWETVKKLTWTKVSSEPTSYTDTAQYFLSGSWTCWDYVPLTADVTTPGLYMIEVQKTPLRLEFQFLRDADSMQTIYPDIDGGVGDAFSRVAPIDEYGKGKHWEINGKDGDVFMLKLFRDPEDMSEISVEWDFIENRPVVEIPNRYFLIGTPNNWGEGGAMHEMVHFGSFWETEVQIFAIPTQFQIVENKNLNLIIHPDKPECSQIQQHQVMGPDSEGHGKNWHIGKSNADKARMGDTFKVRLELEPKRVVSWKKRD